MPNGAPVSIAHCLGTGKEGPAPVCCVAVAVAVCVFASASAYSGWTGMDDGLAS
jgi:hypothetical protein